MRSQNHPSTNRNGTCGSPAYSLKPLLDRARGLVTLLAVFAALRPVGLAQDVTTRAWEDVAVLTSAALKGRGFNGGGHLDAAEALRRRFREIGLQPLGDDYFQAFDVETDRFDGPLHFAVDDRDWMPGLEFLPHPASASGTEVQGLPVAECGYGLSFGDSVSSSFDARAVALTAEIPDSLAEGLSPEIRRVETRILQAVSAGALAVVLRVDRLSFGISYLDAPVPIFLVLQELWPAGAARVRFEVHTDRDVRETAYNVMGRIPGTRRPDSLLLVTAHYDHLGALNDTLYFPGANDNASGVALLLALADTIASRPLAYSVVFVAFSAEEQGLVGSSAFAISPPVPLERIRFLLNFDMVASGEAGVVAVAGVDFSDEFALLEDTAAQLGGPAVGKRPNAPNSDHFPLVETGVRGFFLYANKGKQPYHSVNDVADTLEWDDFLDVFRLAYAFLQRIGA